jgi:cytochrome c-type biogenesis protein CcmH/NrfG
MEAVCVGSDNLLTRRRTRPFLGRAEAYAWLGQVLQKENKPSEALAAYNKALALEPNYAWVKYGLLPSVKK